MMFSIIVPVLNAADTLRPCLDSALGQSFRNLEVLCVYDESSDDSLEILQEYAQKDSRIKLLWGTGTNLAGARNVGIAAAVGTYLMFLDADDFLMSDACAALEQAIRETPCDILVFGFHIFPRKPLCPGRYVFQQASRNVFYSTYRSEALFHESSAKPYVWRNCCRRELLVENALRFDERMAVGEDLVFQMEIFPFAKRGIRYLSQKLYAYRWYREGSLQNVYDANLQRKMRGHIQMVQGILTFWKERGLDSTELYPWAIDFLAEEIPDLPEDLRRELSEEVIAVLDDFITHQGLCNMDPLYQTEYEALKSGRKPCPALVRRFHEFLRLGKLYGFGQAVRFLLLRLYHGLRKITGR